MEPSQLILSALEPMSKGGGGMPRRIPDYPDADSG